MFPAPCLGICHVHDITALGVVLLDQLTAADHVVMAQFAVYALRVLPELGKLLTYK